MTEEEQTEVILRAAEGGAFEHLVMFCEPNADIRRHEAERLAFVEALLGERVKPIALNRARYRAPDVKSYWVLSSAYNATYPGRPAPPARFP